jgi:NADP-dependent 3-hydroxy acid dehydrogenase YdfG
VVATARNANKLEDLKILGALTLPLDVTNAEAEIEKVVAEAIKTYRVIDILLNNAGVILEGAAEEAR